MRRTWLLAGLLGACMLGVTVGLLLSSPFPLAPAEWHHPQQPSPTEFERDSAAGRHSCRFWGMIGTAPQDSILDDQLVSGTYSLRELGEDNPHGWGIAYYAPTIIAAGWEGPVFVRGGPKANHEFDDRFPEAIAKMLTLDPFCASAHVRHSSGSHTDIPDPHPFWRDSLVLAHNGSLSSSEMVSLLEENDPDYLEAHPPDYRNSYLDSELFLLYILQLRETGVGRDHGRRTHALHDVIQEATLRVYDAGAIQTAANCLVMSGDTLIAVRFDIDDEDRYKLRYRETPGAWMAASEPMGSDTTGWGVVPPKSLGVFTAMNPPEFIRIFPPDAPHLVIGEITIDDDIEGDSYGNGDGDCDAGEQIELIITLRNEGYETAFNTRATIATEDFLCQITDDYEEYGDIAPGEELPCLEDFDLFIDPQCPDGHLLAFTMTVECDSAQIWERQFTLDVHAPNIELDCYTVDDSSCGNGNGRIEPGERFLLTITLANTGSEQATDLQIILEIAHPLATIWQGEAVLDTLPVGGTAEPAPPFEVEVHDTILDPDVLLAALAITADWDLSVRVEFMMPVGGFYDDMESGPGNWTTYVVTNGFYNQWHHSQQRNYTPGGNWSWKFGDTGDGDYTNLADGALESEPVTVRWHSYLRFRHWMEAEVSGSHPGECYDGGMVEISVNDSLWRQIFPVGGYPYKIRDGATQGPWPAETEVYSGGIDWEEALFEITGCEGEARFRFRFGSDGADAREGWYVDEVEFFGSDTDWSGTDEGIPLILHPAVDQNRPNPSGPGTMIHYRLPKRSEVLLQIFDSSGRLVRTLVNGPVEPGPHVVTWDGRSNADVAVESGAYFYRFATQGVSQTRKIILIH